MVQAVGSQCGFIAWWKLCQHFEPQVEAGLWEVYARLGKLNSVRNKTVSDTRSMLLKLEEICLEIHEMSGREVDEGQIRTILMATMDPTTKPQILQHSKLPLKDFKRKILEFANTFAI